MPETLDKLRPDRDLQCYFERPSAIAALSEATATGFVVTGTWRQQFDWAVVEWNRDNVFEHPAFRNLPDGDLSGLTLTYDETRTNCMEMDSTLFATVDWPSLRIWAASGGSEQFYKVKLKNYATAIEGSYAAATAEFTLQGTLTAGDYVGLAWSDEQYNHEVGSGDTLESVAQALVDAINAFSPTVDAERAGTVIRLIYVGAGQTQANSTVGANGNRIGAYGFVSGARTESFSPAWQNFSGGTSPTKWRVTLNFANLLEEAGATVPTQQVRKMRWTYSAALQNGAFQRSEFQVRMSNWTVTGTGRPYQVAGPGSRRIEDDSTELAYSGTWGVSSPGNFSGGSIRYTSVPGSAVNCSYRASGTHTLYLGTRYADNGAQVSVVIDGGTPQTVDLRIAGEDVLARVRLADLGSGVHTVTVSHSGTAGKYFYFDFLESAVPRVELPSFANDADLTLATDWDTDHSIAVAPERTAWMIYSLGFRGRVNHYVGALWWYELVRLGHQYASATITFHGTPAFSEVTQVVINRVGQPSGSQTVLNHVNLIGETADDVAKAFEMLINSGYTAIRASAAGNVLAIYSRSMGEDGNQITVSATPASGVFYAEVSGGTLAGGMNGEWRTDLTALPRLNRAARDWSRTFFQALAAQGLDAVAAFSMELQHGDPSEAAGIAQRYPSGNPVLLTTPALQTNFSPVSTSFWQQVYADMASVMAAAGIQPYLQFGEVQWWYFPYDLSGLPFADTYTKSTFQSAYGFPIRTIINEHVDPALYPEEAEFLPGLIGAFTTAVINYVRGSYPACRFEVLYPTDVNEGAFNRVINYPASAWTPANLDCLKTESFTYTLTRNLDKCLESMRHSAGRGFSRDRRSHLIGIADHVAPWAKEILLARSENVESIVLFALDQFCLFGYPMPMAMSTRSSRRNGY